MSYAVDELDYETAKKSPLIQLNDRNTKPFLKWAGGKGQLLKEIRKFYPFERLEIRKYAEPFVGGGAVLIDILEKYDLDEVYISDINGELINAYRVIRDEAPTLIEMLYKMQEQFLFHEDIEERRICYFSKRQRFNELKMAGTFCDNIEKAALMIFLNKTCFNGLYRVNARGLFNVPMGAYKKPVICDADNIMRVSALLRNVMISHADYRESEHFIDDRTFVYFDPPYRPLSSTANFTSYSENAFDDNNQIELARFINKVHTMGAKVLVSNSDPKNENQLDDFFDSLYAGYNIRRVNAVRMINCRSERRGEIKELLISNYDAEDEPKECDRNMTRTFTSWIDSFKDTIADYKYFIDFDKVHHNIGAIKVELNILNSLIGSQKIEEDFDHLVSDYPSVLKCIPLLLAVRSSEICVYDSGKKFLYDFTNGAAACDYKIFMRETGLFDLIANHVISSLVDYATGVETGLDSNGRKNRGGHLMENLVEGFLMEAGLKRDIDYFKEMYASEIKSRWGLDMSALSNGGRADKRFDFVVKTSSVVYGIETNFYTAGGSKLNETSRSYKQLALEAKEVKGFEFVWFTDGKGWKSARHNLEETFDVMEHLYNINDLENGIAKEIFK